MIVEGKFWDVVRDVVSWLKINLRCRLRPCYYRIAVTTARILMILLLLQIHLMVEGGKASVLCRDHVCLYWLFWGRLPPAVHGDQIAYPIHPEAASRPKAPTPSHPATPSLPGRDSRDCASVVYGEMEPSRLRSIQPQRCRPSSALAFPWCLPSYSLPQHPAQLQVRPRFSALLPR